MDQSSVEESNETRGDFVVQNTAVHHNNKCKRKREDHQLLTCRIANDTGTKSKKELLERSNFGKEVQHSINFREHQEQAGHLLQKVCYGGFCAPVRSTKPLTEPEEFVFATELRLGSKNQVQSGHDGQVNTETPKPKRRKVMKNEAGLTVPEPFCFRVDERAKFRDVTKNSAKAQTQSRSPYISLQPRRYREDNNKVPNRGTASQQVHGGHLSVRKLTRPEEFTFRTETRSRIRTQTRTQVLVNQRQPQQRQSQPHKEDSKSQLVKRRILKRVESGPSARIRCPLTAPGSVQQLHIDTRRAIRSNKSANAKQNAEQTHTTTYHNDNSVSQCSEHSKSQPRGRPLTVPHSPVLHTRMRSSVRQIAAPLDPTITLNKVSEPPPKGPKTPTVQRKLTEPQPFYLHTEHRKETVHDYRTTTSERQNGQSQSHSQQRREQPHTRALDQKSLMLRKKVSPLSDITESVLNIARPALPYLKCRNQLREKQPRNKENEKCPQSCKLDVTRGEKSKQRARRGCESTSSHTSRPLTEPRSPTLHVNLCHQQREKCASLQALSADPPQTSQSYAFMTGLSRDL